MQTQVTAADSGIRLTPLGEAYASNVNAFAPGGCPSGVDPRVWREKLESRVELHLGIVTGLLAMLDDGFDPDLEASISDNGYFNDDDREADCCDDGELDRADDEPSLGAPEMSINPPAYGRRQDGKLYHAAMPWGSQASWARGESDDAEAVNEDGDPLDTHEADELEHGEFCWGDYDSNMLIPGGGSGKL